MAAAAAANRKFYRNDPSDDREKLNGQFNVTAEDKIFERSVFHDFWTYRPLDKSI